MNVRFELTDGLRAKGVRYDLALPGMLGSRPRVEDASLNRYEGVVEFPIRDQVSFMQKGLWLPLNERSRFQKTFAVAVDDGNCGIVIDADVVWLDAHDSSVFLVSFIDEKITFTETGSHEKP